MWVQGGETTIADGFGAGVFLLKDGTNQWTRLARDLPHGGVPELR